MSRIKITSTEIEFTIETIRNHRDNSSNGRFSGDKSYVDRLSACCYSIDEFLKENYRMPTYDEIANIVGQYTGNTGATKNAVHRYIRDLVALGWLIVINDHPFRQWFVDSITKSISEIESFKEADIPDYKSELLLRIQNL